MTAPLKIEGKEGTRILTGPEVRSMPQPDQASMVTTIELAISAGYDIEVADRPDGGLVVKWRSLK